jgi:hypothetical protein
MLIPFIFPYILSGRLLFNKFVSQLITAITTGLIDKGVRGVRVNYEGIPVAVVF